MPRFRPRISILNALLLTMIVAMAITIVQLWREVGTVRAEVRNLRNETGTLSIEDKSKLHAIEVRTNEELMWKWRVWVPTGKPVYVRSQWGNVPKSGVPNDVPNGEQAAILEPGEQCVTLRVKQGPGGNSWTADLETALGSGVLDIDEKDRWWQRTQTTTIDDGVGFSTQVAQHDDQPFVLKRFRVTDNSSNSPAPSKVVEPTAGFIIWLEH